MSLPSHSCLLQDIRALTVFLDARNLTNKRYNAEWVGGGFSELAPPRTWVVEASYRF